MADQLATAVPNVPMASLSTLGVGGPARWFLRAETPRDVRHAHRWALEHGLPMFVVGGGSNLVVADAGVDGLVAQMGIGGLSTRQAGGDTLLQAGAGEPWDSVVRHACELGLAGMECLSGIPGSTGGTPIQNVGAYGQEVAGVVEAVDVFDCHRDEMSSISAEACGFGYRMSRFKSEDAGRFVVCGVTFRLRPGPATVVYPDVKAAVRELTSPGVADVREAVLAIRRRKGMVLDERDPDTRSVGSFFMNPVVTRELHEQLERVTGAPVPSFAVDDARVKVPAAWLIERAGFQRGDVDGAAGISTKHTLAIVNRGGATARDILRLAVAIKRRVSDRFGILLRPEPVLLGFEQDPDVEFLRA